jgi:hypothetical protein
MTHPLFVVFFASQPAPADELGIAYLQNDIERSAPEIAASGRRAGR